MTATTVIAGPPPPAGPAAALAPSLTHTLFGMGFRNVRAGSEGDLLPARPDGPAPDVTARATSGRVDAFALTTAGALREVGEAERVRALARAAEAARAAFWVVVPLRDRAAAADRLRDLGVDARLLGV